MSNDERTPSLVPALIIPKTNPCRSARPASGPRSKAPGLSQGLSKGLGVHGTTKDKDVNTKDSAIRPIPSGNPTDKTKQRYVKSTLKSTKGKAKSLEAKSPKEPTEHASVGLGCEEEPSPDGPVSSDDGHKNGSPPPVRVSLQLARKAALHRYNSKSVQKKSQQTGNKDCSGAGNIPEIIATTVTRVNVENTARAKKSKIPRPISDPGRNTKKTVGDAATKTPTIASTTPTLNPEKHNPKPQSQRKNKIPTLVISTRPKCKDIQNKGKEGPAADLKVSTPTATPVQRRLKSPTKVKFPRIPHAIKVSSTFKNFFQSTLTTLPVISSTKVASSSASSSKRNAKRALLLAESMGLLHNLGDGCRGQNRGRDGRGTATGGPR